MRSTSRSGMRRRSARVLAGGLLALGLCGPASAQPPPLPVKSTYAFQVPKSDDEPKPPAPLKVDVPPQVADEPPKPKVTIGPSEPTVPVPVDPPVVVVAERAPVAPRLATIPPITPMPRPGGFIIPPDGRGYYSLQEFLRRTLREQPPRFPYPPIGPSPGLPFDEDFRYIDDPANTQHDWFDCVKRIHFKVRDDWMVSFGGEFRYRYMDETNSRLSGVDNNYSLFRTRVHADIWKGDEFRLFIEFLSAESINQSLPPLLIDRNPAEIQNLFVDYRLLDDGRSGPLWVRIGRQEMLYGSQRLISPLDWANTRRTFDGVKFFWHSENWDVDAFWTKPVIPDPVYLDWWDRDQNFSGAWATWKPKKGTAVDFYVLNLNHSRPVAVGRNGVRGGFDITTFGVRASGDVDGRFLYDHEAMLQTGIRANQEVEAGAYAFGFGYRAKSLPWNPTFWVYNDWASGTAAPGGPGKYTTFNQLFPFGHYYFGFNDFVGRQNINDFNLQLSVNPQPWITFLVQYHNFTLVAARDALYNAAGAPIRVDPTGFSGRSVGQEVDYMLNIHITAHQDLLIGYSRFYAGNFIRLTGNPNNADLFYAQYSFKW